MKYTGLNSYKSWGIVVVCSIVNFLSLLPIRISGLLFVALMEHYSIGRKMAAQPIIISTIIRTALGPLVGYLGGIYECRTIIIWGAILSSVGFGACYFAEEIIFVTISIGLVYGLGLAFGNTLIPLIIKQHFDKHASKANGLAFVGCCLNAILIPPLFEYFLETYGMPGAFLISSGIMLNGFPAGMLLKNPKYRRRTQVPKIEEPKQESRPNTTIIDDEVVIKPLIYESEKLMTTLALEDVILQSGSLHCSTISLATLDERSSLVLEGLDCNVCVLKTQNNEGSTEEIDTFIRTNENGVTDIKPLPHETKQPMGWGRFAVFKQPSYFIILITQATQGLILFTVWTIIIDLSRDKNIPSHQELYFLMFLPVSEMFGYLGLTWVTDGGYLTSSQFCVCCYTLLGFSCTALVWSQTFWTLMASILCFSFISAAVSTVLPIMVFEIIEEKHHAMAMASRFMLIGPCGLAMPSVIGFFRENLGSYDGLLYLLASLSLFSSFLFILLPYIVSCKSKKGNS